MNDLNRVCDIFELAPCHLDSEYPYGARNAETGEIFAAADLKTLYYSLRKYCRVTSR